MMKWIPVMLMMFFVSCKEPKDTTTQIQDEVLQQMMIDLYVADVAINKYPARLRDSIRWVYRNQLSGIYGMTPRSMDSLVLEIEEDFDRYTQLTDTVLSKIQALNDSLKVKDEVDELKG